MPSHMIPSNHVLKFCRAEEKSVPITNLGEVFVDFVEVLVDGVVPERNPPHTHRLRKMLVVTCL